MSDSRHRSSHTGKERNIEMHGSWENSLLCQPPVFHYRTHEPIERPGNQTHTLSITEGVRQLEDGGGGCGYLEEVVENKSASQQPSLTLTTPAVGYSSSTTYIFSRVTTCREHQPGLAQTSKEICCLTTPYIIAHLFRPLDPLKWVMERCAHANNTDPKSLASLIKHIPNPSS